MPRGFVVTAVGLPFAAVVFPDESDEKSCIYGNTTFVCECTLSTANNSKTSKKLNFLQKLGIIIVKIIAGIGLLFFLTNYVFAN